MEYDVFISYSSIDGDVAQKVWTYLRMRGLNPWIAPQCIPAGEPYARAIINGITKCRLMVVILSKASNSSDDVLNEIDQAHREKKVILPFIIDNTEMSGEMKYYLSRKQWINAYPEVTTAQYEQLFRAIRAYLPAHEEARQEIEERQEKKSDKALSGNYTLIAETPSGNYTLIVNEEASDRGRSMMEKFPEMELVPTSLYDWRKPKKSRFFSIIFFAISLGPLYVFINCLICRFTIKWGGAYINEIKVVRCDPAIDTDETPYYYLLQVDYGESTRQIGMVRGFIYVYDRSEFADIVGDTEEEVRIEVLKTIDRKREWKLNEIKKECVLYCFWSVVSALPFLFLGWLFYARYPKKGSATLSSLADYIQKYRYKRKTRLGKKPQFVFFVKDCLFGVMNVADYKVQIPAEYERISWKAKDTLIKVTKDGHDFIIDINGKRLQ